MALATGLRYGTTVTGEALGHQNIPILGKMYDDNFITQANWGGEFYRAEQSLDVFRQALDKVPWKPDLILILSGYDAHKEDQGRNIMDWTNEDFGSLTKFVLDFAGKVGCHVLSMHGGGFTLPVAISAACSHVETLATFQSNTRIN